MSYKILEEKKRKEQEALAKDMFPDLYLESGNVNLQSNTAQEFLKDYDPPKAFNKVGYARSLGGFFYQFFFAIIGAVVISGLYPLMLKYVYPFPESKSYVGFSGTLFALVAAIMNVPTGYAIERYIGEWRIKDTRKMVQYIRFYLWYQMMTGVVLVAAFSWFTLDMLGSGNNLTWAKWLMLILISREYPANTSVFLSSLKGLQQFNYESYCNFANDTFIKPLFEIGFVLWGGMVLGANPQYGLLMGIAIGYALGTYLAEFVSMGFAMYYFQKALKPMGYTVLDCFIPRVDRDVMWNSFKFGFFVQLPSLFSSAMGTLTALLNYSMIPAYLTLTALSTTADELANLIKRGGGINVKATISEAALNGKKNLTSYYISMSWKFIFFFMFALGSIVMSFMPLLVGVLFSALGATSYVLAAAFIIPNLIATTLEEPQGLAGMILVGGNKPLFNSVVDIVLGLFNTGMLFFWLYVFRIQDYGLTALIWWIPLNSFPQNFIAMILKWIYINKKVAPVKVKEFAWQAFVAPLIPALIIAGVAQLWINFVFPPLVAAMGGDAIATIIGGVITVLFGFIGCLMFMFFPLYTFFGGNDENTLAIFHEAVQISGPSRFLFKPIDKAMLLLGKKSKLHNKYKIPYELAELEAQELMRERHIKDKVVNLIKIKTGEVV